MKPLRKIKKMDKIVEISKEINPAKQEKAENTHKEILVRTIVTASNLIELGKLFKEVRDEKLYKLLGADTFKEYCGFPEISFGRSTIYSFIYVYELFILKLKYASDYLSKIGHRKLQIISSVVTSELGKDLEDTDFWLDNAEVLSESDLINAVRSFQGKPEMLPLPKKIEELKYYKFNKTGWVEFVTKSPCILHPERKSENAHFPRTHARGGEYWQIIPLCHECHMEKQHRDDYDFLWLNRYKLFEFFFDLLIGEDGGI